MRRRPAWLALLGVAVVGGCSGQEYALLVQAWPDAAGLPAGTQVTVHVRDLSSRATSVQVEALGEALPADRPLRVAVELHAAAQLMVHLSADGGGLSLGATRCFTVMDVVRADVLLLDASADDADGDGWPAQDRCRERGSDQEGCRNQCPAELAGDCDDGDPDTSPGALDPCADTFDQDCFEGDAECADADGDGFTECPAAAPPPDCDCDDTDRKIHPAVRETARVEDELCENGIDDDCDGRDARCDRDHDGFAGCAGDDPLPGCDCDDDDDRRYPGATETPAGECDHLDNNCNGAVDEVRACLSDDLDGDGAPWDCRGQGAGCQVDCNDCNAAMAPGRGPVCGNRIDEACALGGSDDGGLLPAGADACPAGDADQDGYAGTAAGGTDCDDADPQTHPGAPDRCGGGSQDCSGADTTCEADRDRDGWNESNDCDDAAADANPDQPERCNDQDDDCDGIVNEVDEAGRGCISLPAEGGVAWQELELATSLLNCGRCRNDCNADCDGTLCRADACVAGACACAGGAACAGTPADTCCAGGCRDTQNDVNECGGCGRRCDAPVCQRPVCRDGVCATVPADDGAACGDGHVCCGGACVGDCAPGAVGERGCGDCGTERRSCGDDCRWGGWGGCQGEGACTPLVTQRQGCGNCGSQERVCGLGCGWSGWGACFGEGACAPGSDETRPCGSCGTQSRSCGADCSFGGWGACGGEGACAAGATETEACGNCGTRTRTCSAECGWGGWGACTGEGACANGDTESEACGNCGTHARACGADCAWGAWAACAGEGECAAGDTDPRACGNCGTQTRTCGADCAWGGWGSCAEGACAAGTSEPCGNCGTRTCGADCNWGACTGEGTCVAGATEQQQCPGNGPQQTRTCGADCAWGAWAPACP